MRKARVNGRLVVAESRAPDTAACPECGAEVQKRRRKCMDGSITYFYRHKRGEEKDCPRRYRPT